MKDGPVIASVAALIGDPARANILTALMDGRALTASELAEVAGVTLPTASGHLANLADAALVAVEKQGRHRYYRLHSADVAEVLEKLMGLAQRSGAVRVRTGPRDDAMREARICYDHLAGAQGIDLDSLERKRRPICLHCLDWSERRHHLAGSLGAAILQRSLALGWIKHGDGRTLIVTSSGRSAFSRAFA